MAWGKPRRKSKQPEVPAAPFEWPRLLDQAPTTVRVGGGRIGPLRATEVRHVYAWLGEGGPRYYRITSRQRRGMEPMNIATDVTDRIENRKRVEERREVKLEASARQMRLLDTGSVIGPTAETKAKMRQRPDPLRRLLLAEKIDWTELRAAEEIERISMRISAPLLIKSSKMESGSGGAQPDFLTRILPVLEAWRDRYRPWAEMLEGWRVRHNTWPVHGVVIGVVVDGWTIRDVEVMNEMRHGAAAPALVLGLKAYAMLAGWRRPARQKHGCALQVGLPTICEVCGDSTDPAVKALMRCKPKKATWPDLDAPYETVKAPAGYYSRVTPDRGQAAPVRVGKSGSAIDLVMPFLPKAKKGKGR